MRRGRLGALFAVCGVVLLCLVPVSRLSAAPGAPTTTGPIEVHFLCTFNGITIADWATVRITAPSSVEPGDTFPVTLSVVDGPSSGALQPSSTVIYSAASDLALTGASVPKTSTDEVLIPPQNIVPSEPIDAIPPMTAQVTAGSGPVKIRLETIYVAWRVLAWPDSPIVLQSFLCVCQATSDLEITIPNGGGGGTTTTSATTTTTSPPATTTTTTAPGATTTTTAPGATTTTTALGATTTTTAPGVTTTTTPATTTTTAPATTTTTSAPAATTTTTAPGATTTTQQGSTTTTTTTPSSQATTTTAPSSVAGVTTTLPGDSTSGTSVERPPTGSATVEGAVSDRSTQPLAFTGGGIPLAIAGSAMLLVGSVLVLTDRRRRPADS